MPKINVCPACGFKLSSSLKDGIAQCQHCNFVFDSSEYNALLAASWQARTQNFTVEQIKNNTGLDEISCSFIHMSAIFSHEDFVVLLQKLKSTLSQID